MTRQDEPITPAAVWWAIARTLDGHADGRRCPQCRPDGCAQLAWAQRERGAPVPAR